MYILSFYHICTVVYIFCKQGEIVVSKSDIKKRFAVSKILATMFVVELIRLCINFDMNEFHSLLMLLMFIISMVASIYIFRKRRNIDSESNLCIVNILLCFVIVVMEMIITNFGFMGVGIPLLMCDSPKHMQCMFTARNAIFLYPLSTLSIYLCCFTYVKLYSKCYIKSINNS